ncbi:class III signal peptide-containing protein [Thermococcus sp.]
MESRRGQGSLEYLFMIAAALVIVLIVIRVLSGVSSNTPNQQVILYADPENFPTFNTSDNYFVYQTTVTKIGDDLYNVTFKAIAKRDLSHVKIRATLMCNKKPVYVGDQYLTVTDEVENLPKGWYISRYWSPIRRDEFPCEVVLYVWVG